MSRSNEESVGWWLDRAWKFATSGEPRRAWSRRSVVFDVTLAGAVTLGSLATVRFAPSDALVAVVTSLPIVVRRRFPLSSFLVIALAVAFTRAPTDVTVLAMVIASYSAVVYGRFRNASTLALPLGCVAVAVALWNAPATRHSGSSASSVSVFPSLPGFRGLEFGPQFPMRPAVVVVVFAVVSIAAVGYVLQARQRIHRLRDEHEAATVRELALERARIATELHDVVTHNVSVMVVQTGAARKVLGDIPQDATNALLAVEDSGRAAMSELRHLLGLLSPTPSATGEPASTDRPASDRKPQPDLVRIHSLVDRVRATGLPVHLIEDEPLFSVPAGVALAAYRVVQEGLTNVMKHAPGAATNVTVTNRNGCLLVEVADEGDPTTARNTKPANGSGRGLFGLRERVELYGGALEHGPRASGGWLLRARIPTDGSVRPAPVVGASPVRPT
ncbi:MAG: sensor histidine kinase [Acidimicrobiales bacterium]